MTSRQPRDTTLICSHCGFVTRLTTASLAEYALTRHSCESHRERVARSQRRIDRLQESGEVRDCQHPRAKHEHGTRTAYVLDKCRCRPCRDAARAYEADRTRTVLYGRDTGWVDAKPVRKHLKALARQGIGLKQVAKASGVPYSNLGRIIWGRTERGEGPAKRLRADNAARILAVTPDDASEGMLVDSLGTRRRIQALMTLGWSVQRQAQQCGLDHQRLRNALAGRQVRRSTAIPVAAMFDRLWNTQAPGIDQRTRISVSRTKKYATTHGYLPPATWDDIDDPNETPSIEEVLPAVTTVERRRAQYLVEDALWLLSTGQAPAQIATGLGVKLTSLEQAFRRVGRPIPWAARRAA
jgi:hypothetical protein